MSFRNTNCIINVLHAIITLPLSRRTKGEKQGLKDDFTEGNGRGGEKSEASLNRFEGTKVLGHVSLR